MKKVQREVFIEELHNRMKENDNIFFLTSDLGSIQLDKIRKDFKDRYINVGIAEQSLVNTGFGLAIEGFSVYCYGISAFLTMRAFEQIRNLSINVQCLKQNGKNVNINLLGVGAGLSYDLSGPSHSCLEDISIMRTLPNIEVISPSDWVIAKRLVDYTLDNNGINNVIKYIRFDGKSVEQIYNEKDDVKIENSFYELRKGDSGICLISTGYMTHVGIKVADYIEKYFFKKIGIIDIFRLKFDNDHKLIDILKKNNYKTIITMEEGFIGKGGLDGMISSILRKYDSNIQLKTAGFQDRYEFRIGNRERLHELNGLDVESIVKIILGNKQGEMINV